jgi:hypothetical protein
VPKISIVTLAVYQCQNPSKLNLSKKFGSLWGLITNDVSNYRSLMIRKLGGTQTLNVHCYKEKFLEFLYTNV